MRFKTINKQLKGLDKKLLGLNNRHFFLLDALVFSLTPLFGIILRLDDISALSQYRSGLVAATLIFSSVKIIIFAFGGFYKRYWKYASIDELTQIAALTTGAVIVNTMILSILEYITELERFLVPRSLTLLDGILTFVLIGGIRFSIRAAERKNQQSKNFYRRDRVLIVGSGRRRGNLFFKRCVATQNWALIL